jgi:O-antigen/teichoic acid export membrane protein
VSEGLDQHLSAAAPPSAPAVLVEEAPRDVGGVRAGSIVFLGIAAANIGNYLFHLVSARVLGPSLYGDVASLTALIGLITLPLVGVQMAVARYVAGFNELGDAASIHVLYRKGLLIGLAAGGALTLILTLASVPLHRLLEISSVTAVVLATLIALPTLLVPVIAGLAQGMQRFWLFAFTIGAGPAIRVVLAAAMFAVGLEVSGAMAATTLSVAISILIPFVALRSWLRPEPEATLAVSRRELVGYLVPVVLGVLAITSLSTIDVLFAKSLFDSETAGLYGSASLVGRVILYLPAAIVFVLLPKVSARAAVGRDTTDVLAKSLLVTAGFCLAAIVVYAAVPELLLSIAFGPDYEDAASFLWLFAVAMSGYAILNVLLAYHLGRGEARFSWFLLGGAVVQIGLFSVFHDTPRELLVTDIAVAGALLVVHEVFVDDLFRRMIRQRLARPRVAS